MNREELNRALESLDMRPGRGLGQNFLQDNNLLDFIVRSAKLESGDKILEVGPGFGALTRLMLNAGAEVYSIEFDHRLAGYLRKNIEDLQFHLIEGDACRVDFPEFVKNGEKFSSVANLPYAISSVYLARLLELENPPQKMVFMLQKEMAQRLAAVPGIKNYGSLSVRTQVLYEVKIIRIVPPEVFFPPPEVESAIVSFELREPVLDNKFLRNFNKLVKIAFAQRRKQLGKVLGGSYGKEKIAEVFKALDLAWEIRPDKLTADDFIKLTQMIYLQ